MILAPGVPGVAFGTEADGDGRNHRSARRTISSTLGISADWAYVDQVHGVHIVTVDHQGNHGSADGICTRTAGLPLAIGTADCVPVALVGAGTVAMLHAGWRGVAGRIVDRAIDDQPPGTFHTAVIGPHIGACCYEIGDEVVEAIGGFKSSTAAGTTSVDLKAAIVAQIDHRVGVKDVSACTMCDDRFASHRRNGTPARQVSLAWL